MTEGQVDSRFCKKTTGIALLAKNILHHPLVSSVVDATRRLAASFVFLKSEAIPG